MPTSTEFNRKIDTVFGKLEQISTDITVIKVQQDTMAHRLDAVQSTLVGPNQDDGLVLRVAQAEGTLKIVKWIGGIAMGIILTASLGAFIYLIATHPLALIGGP